MAQETMIDIRKVSPKKASDAIDQHVGSRVRMRRITLAMSQQKLGDALGLTFQQIQKYEKGSNRIGASRLHQIAHILQVPVEFLFEEAPKLPGTLANEIGKEPSPVYLTDFLASPDGLRLVKAFMRIKSTRLRRSIVGLVQEIAPNDRT